MKITEEMIDVATLKLGPLFNYYNGDIDVRGFVAAALEAAAQADTPASTVGEGDTAKEHWQAWARKRLEIQRKHWVRAAKAALGGDMRELRNRIELSEAEPVELVQSALASPPVAAKEAVEVKGLADQILSLEVSYTPDECAGLSDWGAFEAGIGKGLEAAVKHLRAALSRTTEEEG